MKEYLGGAVSAAAAERLEQFWRFLVEKNKVMNLTAITDDEAGANLHFLDSLSILRAADLKGKTLVDVGTGAGFPGMPLAIAEDVHVTLLDSQQKRIEFLREACALVGVEAELIHARSEELGLSKKYRESFDFATSRAVARLDMLCELCLPLVKVGGAFIAMKGSGAAEELADAQKAIAKLGGQVREVIPYTVAGGGERSLIVIEKAEKTPAGYPRRFSKIKSSPIK
ncbi:MAG: 16S rRNA (guanine(527)-N(7))-methyltransferase RsmG [Oscillospiraceae bacterium]|nr:16S rRNA (guanine(527)-N(7))-methyltransferase RsmG [Oscillospiraceae bacterium]